MVSGHPDRAIEDWTTHNTFDVKATGLHYRMFRRDGKFFMRQSLRDTNGRESAVDERELTRVVGSGHHSRTYLVAVGNQLFQAPMCWYTKDAVWDLCPGFEENNGHFTREIDDLRLLPQRPDGALPGSATPTPSRSAGTTERCHGQEPDVDRWGAETPTEGDPRSSIRAASGTLRMQICFHVIRD
jgi:hypothetical protein